MMTVILAVREKWYRLTGMEEEHSEEVEESFLFALDRYSF